jgi:hemerythrin-like domain-containing protein
MSRREQGSEGRLRQEATVIRALAVLTGEHEVIARMLARLELELEGLATRGEIDVEALERLLAFFEEHVDGRHQEKEERVFLPLLCARAGGAQAARAAEARGEHAADRERLAAMRGCLEGAAYGDAGALAEIGWLARGYVRHQRVHSGWEERELFALARVVLSAEDENRLRAGFASFDAERPGSLGAAAVALAAWLERRHAHHDLERGRCHPSIA